MARLTQALLAVIVSTLVGADNKLYVGDSAAVHRHSYGIQHIHHGHHRHHHRHHASVHEAAIGAGNASSNTSGHILRPEHAGLHQESAGSTLAAVVTHREDLPKPTMQAATNEQIMEKLKHVETELDQKEDMEKATKVQATRREGQLSVNGPLPSDFPEHFVESVVDATGCSPEDVRLLGAIPKLGSQGKVEEVVFESRDDIVRAVQDQAADPDSKLANGLLHSFLVAKSEQSELGDDDIDVGDNASGHGPPEKKTKTEEKGSVEDHPAAPAGPEVDLAMPFGDLEPFGREDTAKELTESSIRESDAMVDQLERAEVAEEKRSVFRALTRLRGAAVTSFDGIARSQTGNIDDYARSNQWRKEHPVRHLAQDEADVSRWAFPESSD